MLSSFLRPSRVAGIVKRDRAPHALIPIRGFQLSGRRTIRTRREGWNSPSDGARRSAPAPAAELGVAPDCLATRACGRTGRTGLATAGRPPLVAGRRRGPHDGQRRAGRRQRLLHNEIGQARRPSEIVCAARFGADRLALYQRPIGDRIEGRRLRGVTRLVAAHKARRGRSAECRAGSPGPPAGATKTGRSRRLSRGGLGGAAVPPGSVRAARGANLALHNARAFGRRIS